MNVYECISAVSAELAQTGIAKTRSNAQQGYKFRGIDEVMNVLAPVLAKHKLVILPRMLSREQTERQTQKGGVLFSVVVDAEFDFVSAIDSTKHTTKAFGEAMDSADKATNKAMSAAYKYTAFQTFCIPTEGDNDADAHTPEPTAAKVPDGFDAWLTDLTAVADNGSEALKKMWESSSVDPRRHLTATANAKWEGLKKRAAKAVPVPA